MKIWKKTKEFCRKHKTGIIATVSGIGGAIGGILIFKHMQPKDEPVPEIEEAVVPGEASEEEDWSWADPMMQTIVSYEKKCEEGKNIWKEIPYQRERWNKVVEFAKELQPGDGEYYVIEGTNPDCNSDHAEWFVHHWQDEWPSYPTEMVTVQKEE